MALTDILQTNDFGVDFQYDLANISQAIDNAFPDLPKQKKQEMAYLKTMENQKIRQHARAQQAIGQKLMEGGQSQYQGTPTTIQGIQLAQDMPSARPDTSMQAGDTIYTNRPDQYQGEEVYRQEYTPPPAQVQPDMNTPEGARQRYAQLIISGVPEHIAYKDVALGAKTTEPEEIRKLKMIYPGEDLATAHEKYRTAGQKEEKPIRPQSTEVRQEIMRRFLPMVNADKMKGIFSPSGNIAEPLFYQEGLDKYGKESYDYVNKQAEIYSQKGFNPTESTEKAISDNTQRLYKEGWTYDNEKDQWIEPKKAEKTGTPTVGETRKGYRFKGGDPSKKVNWEKM